MVLPMKRQKGIGRFDSSLLYSKNMKATIQILFMFAFSILVTESGYAQSGILEWAKKVDGTLNNFASGIATDCSGNILLTGEYRGTITFGTGEANETILDGGYGLGDYNMYVAKYTPNGLLVWARKASRSSSRNIATDDSGNILVTGTFSDTATFGAGEVNETILTSAGYDDIFVAKYAASGALLWVKKASGSSWEYSRGIADDSFGNILVTGYFKETVTFGAGEVNETILISRPNHSDIFVAKYAPSGVLLWVKSPSGPSKDLGCDIATDNSDNILVTGIFYMTVTFGAGEINETILTSAGRYDIFVAKYASGGELLWVKKEGGPKEDEQWDIATDGSGNILGTGVFRGTAVFGAGEINETVLISDGELDFFITKYAPNGVLTWVKKIGGGGLSWDDGGPSAIATDDSGNILVTGEFRERAIFGEGEVNETVLVSDDQLDIFIARYSSTGDLLWAKKASGPNFDYSSGIAIDGFGNILVTGDFFETLTFGVGEANETTLTSSGFNDIFFAKFSGNITGVAEPTTVTPIPKGFSLEQNYPNPFNPTTTISFVLSKADYVDLIIYNLQGQFVRTLFAGDLEAGRYQFVWDGEDDNGNQISSGNYIYRLKGRDFDETRKLTFVH